MHDEGARRVRGHRQRAEELEQRRPYPLGVRGVLLAHLVSEAVDGGEAAVLMVAPQQPHARRVRVLEQQQRREHLDTLAASVDKVAVEQQAAAGREAISGVARYQREVQALHGAMQVAHDHELVDRLQVEQRRLAGKRDARLL